MNTIRSLLCLAFVRSSPLLHTLTSIEVTIQRPEYVIAAPVRFIHSGFWRVYGVIHQPTQLLLSVSALVI